MINLKSNKKYNEIFCILLLFYIPQKMMKAEIDIFKIKQKTAG